MRRIRRNRTRTDWTDEQLLQLASGSDFFRDGSAWGNPPFGKTTLAEMKACWRENRERLLAEHAAKFPCSRPWAWWEFEADEPQDEDTEEREQLAKLGVLTSEEMQRATFVVKGGDQ